MVLLALVHFRTHESPPGILGGDQLAYLNILVLVRSLECGYLRDWLVFLSVLPWAQLELLSESFLWLYLAS